MVNAVIGRSIQVVNRSSRFFSLSVFPLQLSSAPNFRSSIFIKQRMSTSADLARVKAKAEKTEKILADLQKQIESVKKAAAKQAGLGEEENLAVENEELRKEIESLRKELIVAEIGNGLRQVQMPTKGALSSVTAAALTSAPTPAVNGTAPEPKEKKGEVAGKKTKQTEQPEAGGKKSKSEKKVKESKAEGGDNAKPKKGNATGGGGEGGDAPVDISRLDLRVGKIVAVEKHPDADTLYVEQVDVGEGKNRTIVSGLVNHYPLTAMKDRIAVFMCNLKPVKMRGIFSEGMIMCAVGPEKTEILVPPTDSAIGDRVTVEEYPGTPDVQLNPKKKIWETLKPDIRTNAERVASYKGAALQITGKGVLVAPTLADAQIS